MAEFDKVLLEETARTIYMDLRKGHMRHIAPKVVARRAFQEAKSFVEVTMAIRDGEPIPEPAVADETLYVLVDLWDGSKGVHGEPDLDESGQQKTQVQPVDRYSYAPNLPESHPINQRFLPNAIRNKRLCDRAGNPLTAKQLQEKGLAKVAA